MCYIGILPISFKEPKNWIYVSAKGVVFDGTTMELDIRASFFIIYL